MHPAACNPRYKDVPSYANSFFISNISSISSTFTYHVQPPVQDTGWPKGTNLCHHKTYSNPSFSPILLYGDYF